MRSRASSRLHVHAGCEPGRRRRAARARGESDIISVRPRPEGRMAAPTIEQLAPSGRLRAAPSLANLNSLSLGDLEAIERLLAASPHNRELSTTGDALNSMLVQLPQIEDARKRAVACRILRHMGGQRFTVHNMRFLLATVSRLEERALASASAGGAALEVLQLMGDVLTGAPGASELPSF